MTHVVKHRLVDSSDDGSGTCKYCGTVRWAIFRKRRVCPGTKARAEEWWREKALSSKVPGLRSAEARARLVDALCEICGRKATANDHNHATGSLRGVLCIRCNTGLQLPERPDGWLEKATAYLKRYERGYR